MQHYRDALILGLLYFYWFSNHWQQELFRACALKAIREACVDRYGLFRVYAFYDAPELLLAHVPACVRVHRSKRKWFIQFCSLSKSMSYSSSNGRGFRTPQFPPEPPPRGYSITSSTGSRNALLQFCLRLSDRQDRQLNANQSPRPPPDKCPKCLICTINDHYGSSWIAPPSIALFQDPYCRPFSILGH